jgi:soluble lytic murein transglycosylase-like protein
MLNNVNATIERLKTLPQLLLFREGQLHAQDPVMFPLIVQENTRRQQIEQAAMAQRMGQQAMPPVNQQALAQIAQTPQLPEEQGIGALPARNLEHMADGGIAGYATVGNDGNAAPNPASGPAGQLAFNNEPVMRMADGGIAGYAVGGSPDYSPDVYRRYAIQKAREMGVNPTLADSIFRIESGYNPNAKSKTGPVGIGQLAAETAKGYGLDPKERADGFKNIDASLAFIKDLQGKYNNDPQKIAVAYNQGETFLNSHLKENNGELVPAKLNKPEANNYLKKLGTAVTGFIPSAQAETVPGKAPVVAAKEAPVAAQAPVASQEPWYDRYRKAMMTGEGQRQMMLGVGDLPYNLAGAPVDVATAVLRPFGYKEQKPFMSSEYLKEKATKYLGREAEPTDETLKGFRNIGEMGSMLYSPTRPATMAESGIEALARRQKALAEESKAAVANPRLEAPAKQGETMIADANGVVMPASRREGMLNAISDEQRAAEAASKAEALSKEAAAYKRPLFESGVNPVGAVSAATRVPALLSSTSGTEPQYPNENGPEDRLNMPAPSLTGETGQGLQPNKPTGEGLKPSRDWNDLLLNLGLGLMAGQSPYALQNLGTAGLGALRNEQEKKRYELEERKQAALEALQKQQGQYYGAQAGYLEDLRGPQAALASADKNFAEWQKNPLHLNATPEQARAAYQSFVQDAYKNLGIIHPSSYSLADRRLVEQYATR